MNENKEMNDNEIIGLTATVVGIVGYSYVLYAIPFRRDEHYASSSLSWISGVLFILGLVIARQQ